MAASEIKQELVQEIIRGLGKHWGRGTGPERVAAVARRTYKVAMSANEVRDVMKELGIEDPTVPIRLSPPSEWGYENDR